MTLMDKAQLKELIKTNNIKTTEDIQTALRDMFKDTLQEILEAELDSDLGYIKHDDAADQWIAAPPATSGHAVVFMDAINYNVRQEGHIVSKAAYMRVGVNLGTATRMFWAYGSARPNPPSSSWQF